MTIAVDLGRKATNRTNENSSKIIFSGTKGPMTFSLGMYYLGCEPYKVCSNDDPRLTIKLVKPYVLEIL